jgi:hypothetical protein
MVARTAIARPLGAQAGLRWTAFPVVSRRMPDPSTFAT